MPNSLGGRRPSSHRRVATRLVALVALVALGACGGGRSSDDARTVTVYTGRHYGIEAVFAEFTAATGIEVRFTTGSDPELRERLVAEGSNTPADLVITADAANAALAAAAGLLAPVDSDRLRASVPEALRAEDDTWFALSRRLRVVMYSTAQVDEPPTTYAALGDPEWAGRLCLRPGTHPYTQSLVASLILHRGPDEARAIVDSWVANDPLYINSDTDLLQAIADGDCDVALANTYYLGRKLAQDPAFPVAISWPEQSGTGAHLNISTGAVTANASNRDEAIELLEWLATEGQATFSSANLEYPADPSVAADPVIAAFGTFVADETAVRRLGELNADAVELLLTAGYA